MGMLTVLVKTDAYKPLQFCQNTPEALPEGDDCVTKIDNSTRIHLFRWIYILLKQRVLQLIPSKEDVWANTPCSLMLFPHCEAPKSSCGLYSSHQFVYCVLFPVLPKSHVSVQGRCRQPLFATVSPVFHHHHCSPPSSLCQHYSTISLVVKRRVV